MFSIYPVRSYRYPPTFSNLLAAPHLSAQHPLFSPSIHFLFPASLLATQLQFWILQLHWHPQDTLAQEDPLLIRQAKEDVTDRRETG